MTREATCQPDQDPALWDRHAEGYEATFEPLTDAFAAQALDLLGPLAGRRLLDRCAGAGGAALMAARVQARADAAGLAIRAEVADAAVLDLPDASLDAALSCFGVVLLPDPVPALRAIRRALVPGGRIAVVTWTEPERYELASRLGAAVAAVRPPTPPVAHAAPGPLPAQLRYTDPAALLALMAEGGFPGAAVTRLEAVLPAPSPGALARHLAFAPGLAALMTSLGTDRAAVEDAFARTLEDDRGAGPVSLGAVAHVAVARRPS